MRKIALLLFWMLWSLPLMSQGHSTMYATQPLHILRAGQARAHQAFEGCNQQFQEAASMPRHGQERGPMSGVRHRPRQAAGVRRNRRSQQHAVADIGGGESERQD